MINPFSEIQNQIDFFFPPETHPYRALENAIKEALHEDSVVLDIGCGHNAPNLRALKGRAKQLYGIDLVQFDVDDESFVLINEDITNLKSFANNSIDISYSRSVMEHIEDVDAAYAEVFRVLRPGGKYIFLTPNRYDYASIIATLVPNRLHGKIVRVTEGRNEIDTFPTFYRSNSFDMIRRLAFAQGFRVVRLERLGQYPTYLSFCRPLFWVGCLYEKFIAKISGLDVLKGWIFCILEKPR